ERRLRLDGGIDQGVDQQWQARGLRRSCRRSAHGGSGEHQGHSDRPDRGWREDRVSGVATKTRTPRNLKACTDIEVNTVECGPMSIWDDVSREIQQFTAEIRDLPVSTPAHPASVRRDIESAFDLATPIPL